MLDTLAQLWAELFAGASIILALALAVVVILYKRNERSAIGWLGVLLLSPPLGSVAFLLFGINRIRRRARVLRVDRRGHSAIPVVAGTLPPPTAQGTLPAEMGYLTHLAALTDQVVTRPLVGGNHVEPLVDGSVVFPEMIAAIDGAERSIAMATYIFRRDKTGAEFVAALGNARRRGVEVKVLIDGVGSHYSWPTVVDDLKGQGVETARFLHSFWPWQMPYLNLRSHRKLLIIDGQTAFTGGINITDKYLATAQDASRYRDVHFRLQGPIVGQLMDVFSDDWAFTTDEVLDGELWFPNPQHVGPVHARTIAGGPDQTTDSLRWVILGALAQAEERISIATPYFVPDQQLATVLSLAAMRGVEVDVVMPARNNLPFVKWASSSRMEELIGSGCRLWFSRPDFDHSKLLAIDGAWSMIGSANWDERSLRLNFELDIECYDVAFAQALHGLVESKREGADRLSLELLQARSLSVRLRDGVARLFSPYL